MRKPWMALLLMLMLSLLLCGCSQKDETPSAPQEDGTKAATETAEPEATAEPTQQVTAATLGNHPNNMFQENRTGTSTKALCFGDGRVFFTREDGMLCSFSEDGGDYREHGIAAEEYWHDADADNLNYANGYIYYNAYVRRDDRSVTQIRRFDTRSGTYITMHELLAGESIDAMLIVNDTLFYTVSTYDDARIEALNLSTFAVHTVFEEGYWEWSYEYAFSTDGEYLYFKSIRSILRVPLQEAMAGEVEEQNIASGFYINTLMFDGSGFYGHRTDSETQDKNYNYYAFSDFADVDKYWWSFSEYQPKLILVEDDYINSVTTEEEYVRQLWSYATFACQLNGRTVIMRRIDSPDSDHYAYRLYMAAGLDHRESQPVADLVIVRNEMMIKAGQHNDALYLVLEEEEGIYALHTLTADGVYQ